MTTKSEPRREEIEAASKVIRDEGWPTVPDDIICRALIAAASSLPAPAAARTVTKEILVEVIAHVNGPAGPIATHMNAHRIAEAILPLLAPAAETRERSKIIYEAVWQVCEEWRPGMSDEVKNAIGKRIVERIAKISDEHQALSPSPDAGRPSPEYDALVMMIMRGSHREARDLARPRFVEMCPEERGHAAKLADQGRSLGKEGWREISTWKLEKHGRNVIGYHPTRFGVSEYFWHDDGWTVAAVNGQIIRQSPTHWMPLPAAPQPTDEVEK